MTVQREILPLPSSSSALFPRGSGAADAAACHSYGRAFPGLAPAAGEEADADLLSQAVDSLDGPLRVGLAVASRPADTLVSMGWNGAANVQPSAAPLTAVLRSWEDRFGATVLHVGFDTLDLLVELPGAARWSFWWD